MPTVPADPSKVNAIVTEFNKRFDEEGVNVSEALSILTTLTALAIQGFELETRHTGGLDAIFEKFREVTLVNLNSLREHGATNFEEAHREAKEGRGTLQ